MNRPRRYVAFFTTLALWSISCGVAPVGAPTTTPATGSLVARLASATQLSADTVKAARVLGGLHTGLAPEEVAQLSVAVALEARRSVMPVELVLAVIRVESSGNAFVVSHAGAIGLMQLLPATAEDVAQRNGVRWAGPATLFDPTANVRLGTAYLRELIDRHGSVAVALAAYNWGPTRIAARLRRGESLPVDYAERVMAAVDPMSMESIREI